MNSKIISLQANKSFTLSEANNLMLLIYKITKKSSEQVDSLFEKLKNISDVQEKKEIEALANAVIKTWNQKVFKLGALPKGIWLVDFDSKDGYFCWKYPEEKISYWHHYDDGYTNRTSVEQWTRSQNEKKKELETAPKEESLPSLKQFFLDNDLDPSHDETNM